MDFYTIALFGEAEKGQYSRAYFCQSLPQLVESCGNPPPHSRGIYYAVQALLYGCSVMFFRVKEEGFSRQDYLEGLHLLESQQLVTPISAFCLPGVGNSTILEAVIPLCAVYHSVMITNEPDLYDYLTEAVA